MHLIGISFFISPIGQVKIYSTFEKVVSHDLSPCGYETPQKSLPELDVETLVLKLSKKIFEGHNSFGFFSVKLLSFRDPTDTPLSPMTRSSANSNHPTHTELF